MTCKCVSQTEIFFFFPVVRCKVHSRHQKLTLLWCWSCWKLALAPLSPTLGHGRWKRYLQLKTRCWVNDAHFFFLIAGVKSSLSDAIPPVFFFKFAFLSVFFPLKYEANDCCLCVCVNSCNLKLLRCAVSLFRPPPTEHFKNIFAYLNSQIKQVRCQRIQLCHQEIIFSWLDVVLFTIWVASGF